nr:LysR family transcriptional regulator [Actinomycetospora corticicola]
MLDLRLFVAVLDEGSITAGADRLPLSLPSASARIRALEARAGVTLLARGRRGVRPTPAGVAFGRRAREALDALGRLDTAVAPYVAPAARRLTLVAGSSAMERLVPRALVAFLSTHAEVDVALLERSTADGLRLLADGEVDLGIVIADPRDGPPAPGDRLVDDSLVVIGAAGGVLAGTDRVGFAEVAEHPMVGLAVDAPLQATLEANVGDRAPLARLRGRAARLGTVVDLVAAGVGLAVVPRHVVDPGRGLEVSELAEPWAHRTLVLRRGTRARPGVEEFAAALRAAAGHDAASVGAEG